MWDYPNTRRQIVTDEMHGRKIDDPYRWLEDSDSAEVIEWSKEQNQFAEKVIREGRDPDEFKGELEKLSHIDASSLPSELHNWYYWTGAKSDEDRASIYRKFGLNGEPEMLLDANMLSATDTVAVTHWNISFTGRYFSYALSEKGAEMGTLYICDMTSGDLSPIDEIPHVRYPRIAWVRDGESFYYTRYPVPGTVPVVDEQYYCRVYYHVVGTPWQEDKVIFGDGRHKEDLYDIGVSNDRRWIIFSASRAQLKNEIYLLDIETDLIRPIVEGINSRFSLSILDDRPYLLTIFNAEFGRVLTFDSIDVPASINDWYEFLPERKGEMLANLSFTSEILITEYLIEGESKVEILSHDGSFLRMLPLPPLAHLSGISCRPSKAEYFYSYTTYLEPRVQYYCASSTSEPEVYDRLAVSEDMSLYTVTKEYVTSKDGTCIPVALVYLKDITLDGTNPVLLYGYGGFANINTPGFIRGMIPFVKRGGVYAIALIRGGGEGGDEWHKAGILERKQNSFDDFIASAEMLVERGYTCPEKLGIWGGSNGGLLVGACATQRPDLFRAVICQVPLLDMVRFPKFLIASRWISEYGDPGKAEDFKRIMTWSPYHNVVERTPYPAWLIMTGDHDTRVEPLHARKMAALLQSRNDQRPVLVRTEIDAGHGAGTSRSKSINALANILAFLAWQLDM